MCHIQQQRIIDRFTSIVLVVCEKGVVILHLAAQTTWFCCSTECYAFESEFHKAGVIAHKKGCINFRIVVATVFFKRLTQITDCFREPKIYVSVCGVPALRILGWHWKIRSILFGCLINQVSQRQLHFVFMKYIFAKLVEITNVYINGSKLKMKKIFYYIFE